MSRRACVEQATRPHKLTSTQRFGRTACWFPETRAGSYFHSCLPGFRPPTSQRREEPIDLQVTHNQHNQKGYNIMATPKTAAPEETTAAPAPAAVEPDFAALLTALVTAETEAKAIGADAREASQKKSTVAVSTIKAALTEKVKSDDVRKRLIDAGVAKGTVSKIVQIIDAVRGKVFGIDRVKSLNGGYQLVKVAEKTAATVAATPGGTPAAAAAPAAVVATTPDQALKVIIDSIKAEKDSDAAFRLGGEWITKVTNEISAVLKAIEDDE